MRKIDPFTSQSNCSALGFRQVLGLTSPGLTYAVGLHVALVGHAVAPQTLVGVASRQAVLHPVVGRGGDDQQDVANNRAEEAPSHEAVHPELKQRSFCGAAVITANRQGYRALCVEHDEAQSHGLIYLFIFYILNE